MCVDICGGPRNRNRVAPVDDLISERVEVSPNRFIRVLHSSPKVISTSAVNGSVFTNSDGCSISADSQESKNIVVIFFVHGVGGCAELWLEQLNHFCRAGYAVAAPDLLGHGTSSAPRDQAEYEFSELSKDMLVVFDRFSRKRNILVGHSYGSSFCSLISAKRARLVSKVILIAGGGPVPLLPDSCHLFCLPLPMLALIKPVLLCSFERRAFHDRSAIKSCFRKVKAFSAPLYVLKAVIKGQNWERGDLSFHNDLMVPVLLLYGAQDKFVSLEEEQWMLDAIYGCSLEVIQNAGHMVMMESPEKVNWFIHNFLQRDPTTRSTTILSQSRELSKESIHVRCKTRSQSTSRKSLALSLLEEYSGDNPGCSQSISNLHRCSVVSLSAPGISLIKFRSFPGSSSDVRNEHDESQAKVKLKSHEITLHIDDSAKEIRTAQQEEREAITGQPEVHNSSLEVKSTGVKRDSPSPQFGSALSNSSEAEDLPRERRKGILKISTSPLPSLEK